jgi:hypothetical protein
MLLQLENTNRENVMKLIDFANKLNLSLSLIDDAINNNVSLPGKPLTDLQLKSMIESSRQSGTISMKDAHQLIRKN